MGFEVTPVPGPSALTAALSASGLPTDRFTFAGFPRKKSGSRRSFFEEVADAPGPPALHVAARDLPVVLDDIEATRGPAEAALFRELRKRFEECLQGPSPAVREAWSKTAAKGDVTLLVAPAPREEWTGEALLELLRGGASPPDLARGCRVSKRRVYQLRLALKG